MKTITVKDPDGSTRVELDIEWDEIFSPEFKEFVKGLLVTEAMANIGDNPAYEGAQCICTVTELITPAIENAKSKLIERLLFEIVQDPMTAYVSVFGKDEEGCGN